MKKFLVFLLLFCMNFFLPVLGREKSVIVFNKFPISEDTIVSSSNTNIFSPGERIYYLVTLPKKLQKQMLLIQILKVGSSPDERLGYELVWGKRVKVRDEQTHYFSDYVVLNSTGAYAMRIYSRDNPTKILTSAYFYVRN